MPDFKETTPIEILRDCFGFECFQDHQEAVIETLISGGDAFVLMRKGGCPLVN